MNTNQLVMELKKLKSEKNKQGMARFGIVSKNALGVAVPKLRKIAKDIGKNHELAQKFWKNKIHELKLIAIFIQESEKISSKQMDEWVQDFYSWDICDQCCSVWAKSKLSWNKPSSWAKSNKEFVRRAAFAQIACLAVHDKKAKNTDFIKFFPLIKKYSTDDRNFVKKSVNWALRQIGKRNWYLNRQAIKTAKNIKKIDSKSARWVASNAFSELTKVKKMRQ